MKFSYRRSATDDETVDVEVTPSAEHEALYHVTVGERHFELSASLLQRAAFWKEAGEITLQHEGREYHLFDAQQRRRPAPSAPGDLRAPMAGKIIRVLVQLGDVVQAGDPLLILEAMKMEQQITAPEDGTIAQLLCQEGDQVTAGAELVVIAPTAESST